MTEMPKVLFALTPLIQFDKLNVKFSKLTFPRTIFFPTSILNKFAE